MNIRLLRRVQKAILRHPDQFEMNWWMEKYLKFAGQWILAGGCGTAACIGGWACHLAGKSKKLNTTSRRVNKSARGFAVRAAKLLGVNDSEAKRLFNHYCWPSKFQCGYDCADTPEARAKIAAARIDRFISTKGKK